MPSEESLRLVFAVHLAVLMTGGLHYRLKSFTGEPLHRLDEGLLMLVGLRLSGFAALGGMFAWLIHPDSMRWSQIDLPLAVRWAGIPALWVCGAWLGWMAHHLGRNLTDTVNVRRAARLVTSGPYRWVRHPMYVGVAGLMLSLGLITANVLVLALAAIVVPALLVRTRTEEAKLLERFGDDYRAYRERTGFVFPKRMPDKGSNQSALPSSRSTAAISADSTSGATSDARGLVS